MNIEIANQQQSLAVNLEPLRAAIALVAREADFREGEISLAIVTDEEIHRLNQKHLNHDYETDVLSFVFERHSGYLEGEIIVSADTAISASQELSNSHETRWPPEHELLLYVVHGMLHLVGYNDKQPAEQQAMRAAERHAMEQLGILMVGVKEVGLE